MNLQYILIIISILLVAMLGLLIWVIRFVVKKNQVSQVESPSLLKRQLPKNNQVNQPIKYQHSKLNVADKARYLATIITYLETEKIYRQPDLTIYQLAEKTGIKKYHLSQVINENRKGNFFDFINRYRVAEAKEKLLNTDFQDCSILEIGKLVGFNAKSTFYAAFKKYTHQTPGDFRKTMLINQKE